MTQVRLLTMFAALMVAVVFGVPRLGARQVAPGAPSGLKYVVAPGGAASVQWLHSTGPVTQYILEAGVVPGNPFLALPMLGDGQLYGKMPELVPSFTVAGIAQGDYYVRVRGSNNGVLSAPSNEILLPIRNGCVLPGAPTTFTQIVRGTTGYLAWNPGNGGLPSTYTVRASFVPDDPNPPIQLPLTTLNFTLGIPAGTYFAHVVATNACGVSARSNEIVVTSPGQSPARTPDPAPGERLAIPDVYALVDQAANEAIAQGLMNPAIACPTRNAGPYRDAAHELEARKTQTNPYINYIVDRLRQVDTRFGYNAKPTRAWVPSIIAGDEVAYHYGSDAPEGSPNAYAIDVLLGHCTGVGVVPNNDRNNHQKGFRPFFDEYVRWTGAGRF